tara:strand:- start:255 stop:440 length:186 start_codon:yes stop_codon:yes gene_type:complete
MNRRFILYVNALKYAAAALAGVYMLFRDGKRAREMHELVLCAIAIKWMAVLYTALIKPKKD